MKVANLVNAQKEYGERNSLICEIKRHVSDMDKAVELEPNSSCFGDLYFRGTITTSGFFIDESGKKIKTVDISISSNVSKLIWDETKVILKKHLKELEDKQEKMEI